MQEDSVSRLHYEVQWISSSALSLGSRAHTPFLHFYHEASNHMAMLHNVTFVFVRYCCCALTVHGLKRIRDFKLLWKWNLLIWVGKILLKPSPLSSLSLETGGLSIPQDIGRTQDSQTNSGPVDDHNDEMGAAEYPYFSFCCCCLFSGFFMLHILFTTVTWSQISWRTAKWKQTL